MNTTVNFINGSESNNWSKIEAGQSFELRKSKKEKTQLNNAFDLSSSFAHGSKDAMMRPKNKEGLTLFNECAIYLGDYIEKPEQTNSEMIESLIKRKVVESMNGDIHLTTNNFGTVSYERTLFISKSKQYVYEVGKGANEEEARENCSWKLLQRLYSLGVIQEYSFEFGRAKTILAKAASNTINPKVSMYCDLTTETLEDFIHFLSM
uniref:Uncharacterized protein n=1 Tax=Acrobeloides nanus TaxID=290746 RepID=A0A914CKW3_9BILA